eukprot:CAMPEP_0204171242 /NCGR_PEP_ID=MMETSP0361-20130328/43065_1 /ASSEMBLY_ACC=CAM_ASM_000343 /TAXON_ID=268821 /ORGANISM="Scrippsiella Hangoei, Strain SHTV-5" /LENGTH=576 /DNA_ID=CAMNT_0051129095 /DNA_START=42 /DNA_END=1770 /DNA_ORIENTATION=+
MTRTCNSTLGSVEAPLPDGDLEAWSEHPRLQRHLRMFLSSSDRDAVLCRYKRNFETLPLKARQRQVVHVGAWVALLPFAGGVWFPACARLLTYMLAHLGHSRQSLWLRGVLQLVARRLQCEADEAVQTLADDVLAELKRYIPQGVCFIVGTKRDRDRSIEHDKVNDDCTSMLQKAPEALGDTVCKVFHREQQSEDRSSGTSVDAQCFSIEEPPIAELFLEDARQFAACCLEQRLQLALALADKAHVVSRDGRAFELCRLLLRAVAWLAKPRRLGMKSLSGQPMREQSKRELRAETQTHVRRALTYCLEALELLDDCIRQRPEVALALTAIRDKICSTDLSHVMSCHQWLRIQTLLPQDMRPDKKSEAPEAAVSFHKSWMGQDLTASVANIEQTSGCVQARGATLRMDIVQRPGDIDDSFASCPISSCNGVDVLECVVAASRKVDPSTVSHKSISDGVYTPNPKVRALAHVEHRSQDEKILQCTVCRHQIVSRWFFSYGNGRPLRVLKPQNGHMPCHAKGKAAHFLVLDGSPSSIDVYNSLDIASMALTAGIARVAEAALCAFTTRGSVIAVSAVGH